MSPTPLQRSASIIPLLEQWQSQGWIRSLDLAFARFLESLCPEAQPLVLLSAALLAHVEGQGHSCLYLELGTLERVLTAELARAVQEALPSLRDSQAWIQSLRDCPAIYQEDGADLGQPLVLSGDRLYLRRYWQFERRVAWHVVQRTQGLEHVPKAARDWLNQLFPAVNPLNLDWQKVACAVALTGKLTVITGGPGTGKTYTVARLLALLFALEKDPERLRIALAAPTGKAATRLKQSLDQALQSLAGTSLGTALSMPEPIQRLPSAQTLHALLGARPHTRQFRYDAAHPLDVDVLIVDEASMVHLEMMAALFDAVPASARIILLGDKDQLSSVEAGAVLGDLCREIGRYRPETAQIIQAATGIHLPEKYVDSQASSLAQHIVALQKSRRFGGRIARIARAVNAGSPASVGKRLRWGNYPEVCWIEWGSPESILPIALQGRSGVPGSYAGYLHQLQEQPGVAEAHDHWVRSVLDALDQFRVLCAVREGPWGVQSVNQEVEKYLSAAGLITVNGEWYVGRPVLVTRNDPDLGIFNGDIGVTLKPSPRSSSLRVYFARGESLRSISVSRLTAVETAYAMTIHKSQGSEFGHTLLALPADGAGVTRELIYTGITRAKTALTLITERPEAILQGVERKTQRNSGVLDWIEQFSKTSKRPGSRIPGMEVSGIGMEEEGGKATSATEAAGERAGHIQC